MGQRHQVFIVARISSPNGTSKYRGVGAFHHQWCYGTLPLAALRRFLTLIRQPDNEKIILDELSRVHAVSPTIEIPCPYSLFLLGSAWSVNLDPANPRSPMSEFLDNCLPATMGSFSGDNNDGITVIDITIPNKATYAFLQSRAAILTAEEYARGYYKKGGDRTADFEKYISDAIAALDGEQLMPMATLAAVWPREYRAPEPKEDTSAIVAPTAVLPALADLAIKPAVYQSLDTGSTEALEELLGTLPGKLPLVKESLRALQSFPEAGISLSCKIILQELRSSQKFDLHYPGLTGAQLLDVLSKIRESSPVDMSVIDLSHLSAVTVDVIRSILGSIPELRRLVLLDTAVTSAQLKELFMNEPNLFKTLEALIHPVFFNVLDTITHAGGFSFISKSDARGINSAYVAIWTPERIVRSLIDLLLPITFDSTDIFDYSYTASMSIQCALSSIRREDTPWSERSVTCVAVTSGPQGYGGWTFMIIPADYGPGTKYGFLKPTSENQKIEEGTIYDLDGFLTEAANEGRAIPPAALVKQLRDILESLYSSGPAVIQKGYASDSTVQRPPTPPISEIVITTEDIKGFTFAAMKWQAMSGHLHGPFPTIATT